MMSPKPKVISYERFSSPEQAKGDSLRRQTEATGRYCRDHGLHLDDTIQDKGLSGFHGIHRTKGNMGIFLHLVEEGKIPKGSYLILENLDRFSRQNPYDVVKQFQQITDAGIKLIVADRDQEYSEVTLRKEPYLFQRAIGDMERAHAESKRKSDLIKASWARKRELATSGIKMTRICPDWLRLAEDRKSYIPIPERVDCVLLIFNLKDAKKGLDQIAHFLNAQKTWMPNGMNKRRNVAGWTKGYIRRILGNRAVLGEFQPQKDLIVDGIRKRFPVGEPHIGYYPPVVESDLFNRVAARIEANAKLPGNHGGKIGKISNLFTDLIHCGKCGSPMHFRITREYPYLRCNPELGCRKVSVRYDYLENCILKHLRNLDLSAILPSAKQKNRILAELRQSIESKEAEISLTESQIESLYSELDKMKTARERHRSRIEQKSQSIEKAKAELQTLQSDFQTQSQAKGEATETLEYMQDLIQMMQKAKPSERFEIRQSLKNQLPGIIFKIIVLQDAKKSRTITPPYQIWIYYKTGEYQTIYTGESMTATRPKLSEAKRRELAMRHLAKITKGNLPR